MKTKLTQESAQLPVVVLELISVKLQHNNNLLILTDPPKIEILIREGKNNTERDSQQSDARMDDSHFHRLYYHIELLLTRTTLKPMMIMKLAFSS
jgi:hypothetical protein